MEIVLGFVYGAVVTAIAMYIYACSEQQRRDADQAVSALPDRDWREALIHARARKEAQALRD